MNCVLNGCYIKIMFLKEEIDYVKFNYFKIEIKIMIYERYIRSGEEIYSVNYFIFLGNIYNGVKIILEGFVLVYGVCEGVIVCFGECLILKEVKSV